MEKRIKKAPYFLAIFSLVLLTFFGCNDEFFDQTAGDRITPDKHYQTVIDANVSMAGAFSPLQDIMPKMIMLDGLRSDAMDVTPNTNVDLMAINNQNFTTDNPFTDPAALYKVIINVNEVLANIDSLSNRDQEYDEIVAHALKGGLIGLRSWSYLTLVKLYGKASYINDNMTSLPTNLSQNILTKEEIISDLIIQLTPYVHDASTTQTVEYRIGGFMNIKALLGELYLEINDYTNAAFYLKLACESFGNNKSVYKVDNSYKDAAWGAIFLNAEGQGIENISVVPYTRTDDQFNPLPNWMIYNYLVKPAESLIDSFMTQVSAEGVPSDAWRGKGITFVADTLSIINDSTFVTMPFITKYALDATNPFSSDIIISRAADVHLLLAEAYNRMGDEESQAYALMLLNQGVNNESPKPAAFSRWSSNVGIRGRAYLQSRPIAERDSIPLEERILLIEDQIIAERALELAFEGKRWADLVRIAERRNDPAFLADKVAGKFEGTGKYNEIHTKLMNPANWYLPFE